MKVFALTWLAYAMYYLTRKNLSVVKSRLVDEMGVSTAALASIDTLYLSCYAGSQLLSGMLGDRFGAKRILVIGLVGSAMCSLFFGLASHTVWFAVAFGANGLFQSAGWPCGVKAVTPSLDRATRGRAMGWWSTNYQVGGLVATVFASTCLMHWGWRASFVIPAMVLFGVAALIVACLPSIRSSPETSPGGPSWKGILKSPEIWSLAGAYFGLKLIRYTLLFWLPFYLHRELGYDERSAAWTSLTMEIGGIAGSILTGYAADQYFKTHRAGMVLPMLAGLALALFLFKMHVFALFGVGLFLFGADTLVSGACAQDIGEEKWAASAAGFINGFGSFGAILQGLFTIWISEQYGWSMLFEVLVMVALLSGAVVAIAWLWRRSLHVALTNH